MTRKLVINMMGEIKMNKEEILAKSRKENQNKDIYELEVISKGQRIGGLVGICAAFALMLIERVILDVGTNYGYYFIILSDGTGLWIYKALKIKRKSDIIWAVLWSIVLIYSVVMYTLNLFG